MDDEQFFEFSQLNRERRIEHSVEGDLKVMVLTGGETSNRNFRMSVLSGIWADRDGTGVAFDSNGGFVLPNGAMRSPYASWVRRERLTTLTAEQKQRFLPLCPDFVIEAKMREYVENGARLGWLLDPEECKARLYKPGEPVGILSSPDKLCGDPVLSGFTLDLKLIREPGF